MENKKIFSGVPFMGNKSKIALDIILEIFARHPDMTDFYDLCGGGGSISFNATRLNNVVVHYNEIREEIFNLINFIITHDKMPEDWWNWVSREEFYECRDKIDPKSAMIKLVWSFGNRGISGGYLYGKDIVDLKYLGHQYVVNNDLAAINNIKSLYGIDLSSSINNQYDRRIFLQNEAKKLDNSKFQLEHIQRLERIESNFQGLFRNQHIERLEKIDELFPINKILATNQSYEDVAIIGSKPIIYCDIPYKNTKTYDKILFDYDKFYNWVKTCQHPVYFSEYSAPEEFECVWEKGKYCAISSYNDSRSIKTEKLFWNGIK